MQYFNNREGSVVIKDVISAIRLNKEYLTKVDGEIGDGDHGINMNKGFTMAGDQINDSLNFSEASKILGQVLMLEIGGSMGPLYGTFFKNFFRETKEHEKITAEIFLKMFESALKGVREMGGAEVGDKTMIDTLSPAANGFKDAFEKGLSFEDALIKCIESAKEGRDSTKEMVAKIGRSARLGERSRGILDAGAVSCCIIIETMNKTIISILKTE